MGNSQDKQSLRRAHSVPDTLAASQDAPMLYKEKSRSSQRLNQPSKGGKQSKGKKSKKDAPSDFQLAPSEAVFLPAFPLRGDLEDLDFEIIEVIAKGAYGNVIKVQREDDKRFYATKILNKAQILQDDAVRQCKDEASIQSMAGEHPFIVKAYEYWQSRTNLYLVLDYVPHGDMFILWTYHGAFPEDLVRLQIAELAMVIDYLHSECVIYRDIKMENILYDAYGHIQLTDFGLSKRLQAGDSTRTVCGTLQYMAPEVLSVYPYGHPADWWSVGILMYTMLAGTYPVDGAETHTKMAQRVFECDYLLPSDISDSAQDVIHRVLTKSPHKRLCDLFHLQDLHFFRDLVFSDLMDGHIHPMDVVPPDFFAMTGPSWMPQAFSQSDNKQYEGFDDTNYNYNDKGTYAATPDTHNNQYDDYEAYDPEPYNNNYKHQQEPQQQHGQHQQHYEMEQKQQHRQFEQPPQPQHRQYEKQCEEPQPQHRQYEKQQYEEQQRQFEKATQPQQYDQRQQFHQEHQDKYNPNEKKKSFDDSQYLSRPKGYPEPNKVPSTSAYSHDQPPSLVIRASSSSITRDFLPSTSNQQNFNTDQDFNRQDRFGSTTNSIIDSKRPSNIRESGQMPSSNSYSQDLVAYDASPTHSSYHFPNQHTEYPGKQNNHSGASNLRRGSRDRDIPQNFVSNDASVHSPLSLPSSQRSSFHQNSPLAIVTLPSESVAQSQPKSANVFKMVEPAPTVTLRPVPKINIPKMNNNFKRNAYTENQTGASVERPVSATLVTSPTAKIPPHALSTNQMTGFAQVEKNGIELPTSPVVKGPPMKFPPAKPSVENRFVPSQQPMQANRPVNSASVVNRFQPTQLPPQPPPQSAKPTFVAKPVVAPKPTVAPKPAARKSFNTKKPYNPSNTVIKSDMPQTDGIGIHSTPTRGHHLTFPDVNHDTNFDNLKPDDKPLPADNPRPVPRPRQTVRKSAEIFTDESGQPYLSPTISDGLMTGVQPKPGDPGGSCQWNLPNSSVPSFV